MSARSAPSCIKRVGFAVPIGERRYDLEPISEEATRCAVEVAK